MTCDQYQDLLLSGSAFPDGQDCAPHCAKCAEFADALREIDASLAAQFGAVTAPAGFDGAVLARIAAEPVVLKMVLKPTVFPEVMEAIAWEAIAGIAIGTLWLYRPAQVNMEALALAATALIIIAAMWTSVRCFAEMRH